MFTRNRVIRWTAPVGLIISLSGCNASADYLNHRDTITLAAGNAKNWNLAVHTIDPWPPHAEDTSIEHSGKRLAAVMRDFRGSATQQPVDVTTAAGATTGGGQ